MFNLDGLYYDRYILFLEYFKELNKLDRAIRYIGIDKEDYKKFLHIVAVLKTQDKNEQYSENKKTTSINKIPNKITDKVLDAFLELAMQEIGNNEIFKKFNEEMALSENCIQKIDKFVTKYIEHNSNDLETYTNLFGKWYDLKKVSSNIDFNYKTTHGLMLSNLYDVEKAESKETPTKEKYMSTKLKKKRIQKAKEERENRDRV